MCESQANAGSDRLRYFSGGNGPEISCMVAISTGVAQVLPPSVEVITSSLVGMGPLITSIYGVATYSVPSGPTAGIAPCTASHFVEPAGRPVAGFVQKGAFPSTRLICEKVLPPSVERENASSSLQLLIPPQVPL